MKLALLLKESKWTPELPLIYSSIKLGFKLPHY